MTCQKCEAIKNKIHKLYDNLFGVDVDEQDPVIKKELCISCENKKKYLELSSEQKSIIILYEKNILEGNQSLALNALQQMISLGIDDITIPK